MVGLVGAVFEIIKFVLNIPAWIVFLAIILFSIWYFVRKIYYGDNYDSSDGTEGGAYSSPTHTGEVGQIKFDRVEHPFVFYDSQGERRGRGDCFYDSQGYRRSWGDGFYDGKGYYRSWGDSYYDALGYFRSWGECFYDTQGNLVYPDW